MGQVSASISLHHPEKIILIDHQDCGMYNLSGKIPSGLAPDEDRKKHQEYMEFARKQIQDAFHPIVVELVFAGLDGSFKKL